ncbi:GNAT family N-acetyltransferase [Chitinophaga horti]|uniref:GNAT family N-acetyltransferase n=1 Tax=Chitinophaga horti TaxID=2920382 RepID=A0ABY6J2D6_9BACT|nr:GNAT family N-acetyltransferase [Chitinophaga horti]UYQ93816.1 GNAT family N-acetyltransferase [Chitinophaga horti]
MPTLNDRQILLRPLTTADAAAFYLLYNTQEEKPFEPGETPEQFTNRIMSYCEYIWTIALVDDPGKIIGDCALHHFETTTGEIQVGGALLPEYQGKGYMARAFTLVMDFAASTLGIRIFVGETTPGNFAAIKLVQKLGFEIAGSSGGNVVLKKFVQG